MDSAGPATLAVLVKRFPRHSETFIVGEFLELRRQGLPVRLIAVMDPHESWSQPETDALVGEVAYLRRGSWWRSVPVMARTAARHPRGTRAALAWALRQGSVASWRRLGEGLLLVDRLREHGGQVHLHAHFANVPAADAYVAHLIAGVPFSFTAHAKDLYTTPRRFLAERAAAATFVATCTAANGRYLTDHVGVRPDHLWVCPHGVDVARFSTIARAPAPGSILSIGRLVPKKGFEVLIDACRLLADRGVPFSCRIIGDGPQRDALQERIRALDLGSVVRLDAGRPQPGVLRALGEAEVFALAPVVQPDGDRDGIPNVILEAMSAGLPVVSTDVSGIPEVIDDGETGILVGSDDPVALAHALQRVLADPDLRRSLGAAASRFAVEHIDLAACVRPLAARFRGALAVAGGDGARS